MLHLQQLLDPFHPLVQPLQIHLVHVIGKLDMALFDQIVQRILPPRKMIDVGLRKVQLHGVQCLEEAGQAALRNLVVQVALREMVLF